MGGHKGSGLAIMYVKNNYRAYAQMRKWGLPLGTRCVGGTIGRE